MSSYCQDFRRRLRDALEGSLRGDSSSLESVRPLSWHEHLFSCDECRDLLEAEEALEQVLASMPVPAVPKELARRILERLGVERTAVELANHHTDLDTLLAKADQIQIPINLTESVLHELQDERLAAQGARLELLLDALPEPVVPPSLSAKVLQAVEAQRAPSLDALLNLIPAPEVPAGLAEGILETLEAELGAATTATSSTPVLRPRFGGLRYAGAIAATLIVSFGAWRMTSDSNENQDLNRKGVAKAQGELGTPGGSTSPRTLEEVAGLESNQGTAEKVEALPAVNLPDPSVLASLDVLEDWELLMSDDIDLLLGSLEEADTELLFLASEEEG